MSLEEKIEEIIDPDPVEAAQGEVVKGPGEYINGVAKVTEKEVDGSVTQEVQEGNTNNSNNTTVEPMDILGNGLLVKKVLVAGQGNDTKPVPGDIVSVRSKGQLEDGTQVDVEDCVMFTLGDGDVHQAWDLAVCLMQVRETCELVTDARFAYGELGSPDKVPPNAKITYTLELLKKEPGPDYSMMSAPERLEHVLKKRERGNYYYRRSEWMRALHSYQRALNILDPENCTYNEPPEILQLVLEERVKVLSNIAAAQLKMDAYREVVESCSQIFQLNPKNEKATFRMANAMEKLGETEEALHWYKVTITINSQNKEAYSAVNRLNQIRKKELEKERATYSRMMGVKKPPPQNTKKEKPSKQQQQQQKWSWSKFLAGGAVLAGVAAIGFGVYRYFSN
ncbi:hypothetical protein CHS0354_040248 [Potamilus streckersoni]|uniref:peptidylprolyl isomerase n=1 Tax=Potamilus streckersoni TaxID=2493646 RepID=A0AAE0VPL4_9BIVA|nr:hypothetical protein CHS0354_040248 [Potamilus streckersoni]